MIILMDRKFVFFQPLGYFVMAHILTVMGIVHYSNLFIQDQNVKKINPAVGGDRDGFCPIYLGGR